MVKCIECGKYATHEKIGHWSLSVCFGHGEAKTETVVCFECCKNREVWMALADKAMGPVAEMIEHESECHDRGVECYNNLRWS